MKLAVRFKAAFF